MRGRIVRPVQMARMRDRAELRWLHELLIFFENASETSRFTHTELTTPVLEFGVRQIDAQRALVSVDTDMISVAQECNWAPDDRFRADVSDAHATSGARKAPVGQQCHLLAHSLAVNGC